MLDHLMNLIRSRLSEAHRDTHLDLRSSADFNQFNRREGMLCGIEVAQKIVDECYNELIRGESK